MTYSQIYCSISLKISNWVFLFGKYKRLCGTFHWNWALLPHTHRRRTSHGSIPSITVFAPLVYENRHEWILCWIFHCHWHDGHEKIIVTHWHFSFADILIGLSRVIFALKRQSRGGVGRCNWCGYDMSCWIHPSCLISVMNERKGCLFARKAQINYGYVVQFACFIIFYGWRFI